MRNLKLLNIITLALFSICIVNDGYAQSLDWARSYGNSGNDEGRGISLDQSGNVIVTGTFSGSVDFDPGAGTHKLSSKGNFDVFIQKLDASGKFLWAHSFGSTAYDYGKSVAADKDGNIYLTGSFKGSTDFDPGSGTAIHDTKGNWDVFIVKLGPTGDFKWVKCFGSTDYDEGLGLTTDSKGNAIRTGVFTGYSGF